MRASCAHLRHATAHFELDVKMLPCTAPSSRVHSHQFAGPSPYSSSFACSRCGATRTGPLCHQRARIPTSRANPQAQESGQLSASPILDWLPTVVTGQVFSTSSNFVRVEVPDPYSQSSSSSSGTGQRQLLCSIRALLRKLGQAVLVGDYVRVSSIDWAQNKGQVEEVLLPRSNELMDPSVANVDLALLVFALTQPPLEDVQLSRFLVSMEASRIPFRLLLNKADLVTEDELQAQVNKVRSWGYEPLVVSSSTGRGIEEVTRVLQDKTSVVAGPSGAGKSSLINVLRMGKHRADVHPELPQWPAAPERHTPHKPEAGPAQCPGSGPLPDPEGCPLQHPEGGMEQSAHGGAVLSPLQQDQSSGRQSPQGRGDPPPLGTPGEEGGGGLSGGPLRSGDGKKGASSAIELSQGGEGYLAVGELSKRGKGRHTTTTVTIIRLRGGMGGRLVDTPGFSQPSLEAISASELAMHFPEMQDLLEKDGPCRFSDCMHVDEPGCTILSTADAHKGAQSSQYNSSSSSHGGSSGSSTPGEAMGFEQHAAEADMDGVGAHGSSGGIGPGAALSAGMQLGSQDGVGTVNSSGPGVGASSSHADAAAFSVYSELVPPSIAKLIEREGGVEEWLVEMQSLSDMGGGLRPVHVPPPPARIARHPIYLKFLAEIKAREETDVKTLQAGKRQREGKSKVKVGQGGRRRTEVKLQQQKHRRVSRSRVRQGVKTVWDE